MTGDVQVKAGKDLINEASMSVTNKAGTDLVNRASMSLTNQPASRWRRVLTLKGGLVKIN